MKKINLILFFVMLCVARLYSQDTLPIRGLCISAPTVADMPAFLTFIEKELAPRSLNTLVLRVDYNYQFQSHPELRNSTVLTKDDVKKLVEVCKKYKIHLIPQINLLGHQSWASKCENLLKVYPQFDETPWVKFPEKYEWPNSDGLYCKSYCPLHPDLHKIVFELMDEICDAFETDAFHAGMDEVFYIGEDKCPRCSGKDKAELFANEVNKLREHLDIKNRKLWIWGDRLIDGKTTGIGTWEASMNNTHRAIDLIAKDVVICDWHYERPDPTPIYFAMKGLNIITCPWNKPEIGIQQTMDMYKFRQNSTPEMKAHFQGMMQTVWSDAGSFLKEFYDTSKKDKNTPSNCFREVFSEILKSETKKN